MIAMTVEDAIESLGCEIVGPVAKLEEAQELAERGEYDCAVLDINIRGGKTFALADLLLSRGCPFLLATGYSDWSLPRHLVGEQRLTKPYSFSAIEIALRLLCDRVHLKTKTRNT